jgi:peptidoglycan/LPS O-acetylase OafA/YrhL
MAPAAHPQARRAAAKRAPRRWMAWVLNLAVLAVAALIVCIGVGVVSLKMFLTVGLLFGVPLLLAGLTALVVARRSR